MATTSSKQVCNCSAKAYPKYSKTPSAVVPMPALSTKPCKSCGAKQVGATRRDTLADDEIGKSASDSLCFAPRQLVFSSEPWTSYLQTQVKSLCSKEQLRGDNSSFITVSTPQQSGALFSWSACLFTWRCSHHVPGERDHHGLLSVRLPPGLSGRVLRESHQENLLQQVGCQDGAVPEKRCTKEVSQAGK